MLNTAKTAVSRERILRWNEFFQAFQTHIGTYEICSKSFYLINKIEMFLIGITSAAALIPLQSFENNPFVQFFNSTLSYFFLSPTVFNNPNSIFLLMAAVTASLSMFVMLTFYLGYRFKTHQLLSLSSIKLWVIIHRLVLPVFGTVIGYNFGCYVLQLTQKVVLTELFAIIMTAMVWCWTLITAQSIYDGHFCQRPFDACQIHDAYQGFQTFLSIAPMIQAALPGLLAAFFPTYAPYVLFSIICSASLITAFFVLYSQPYNFISMNQFVVSLIVARIPISFIWSIENLYPQFLMQYCLISSCISFSLYRLIHLFLDYNSSSDTKLEQNHIVDRAQLEEKQNKFQDFDPTANLRYPFYLFSFTIQDIALYIFLFISVSIMTIFNAIAATRMPITQTSLPDLIHEKFPISNSIRSASNYGAYQFSNLVIFLQIFLLFWALFTGRGYFNLRRTVFIYSILTLIRAISFIVTNLPAPCTGSKKCPCADANIISNFRNANPFRIGFSWVFGLGMFLKCPQCGDLIISGHAMFMWIVARTLSSVINYSIPMPFNWLCSSFLYTITVLAFAHIIMARNHFSVDVWFGFLITELLWLSYNFIQKKAMHPSQPNDSYLVKLIRWIEKRPAYRQLFQNQVLMSQQ